MALCQTTDAPDPIAFGEIASLTEPEQVEAGYAQVYSLNDVLQTLDLVMSAASVSITDEPDPFSDLWLRAPE